jgi:hypothetical protein
METDSLLALLVREVAKNRSYLNVEQLAHCWATILTDGGVAESDVRDVTDMMLSMLPLE